MRPRNLNYVLGSIGNRLRQLEAARNCKIPPIVGLVVNSVTGLPGRGGWGFLGLKNPDSQSSEAKHRIFEAACQQIWDYRKWDRVLRWLDLESIESDLADLASAAAQRGGGGESQAHRLLKVHLASHPELLGLNGFSAGTIESRMSSGDSLDILFESRRQVVAIEVKASTASERELARGVFQCVKYGAVLAAEMTIRRPERKKATRVILATPAAWTPKLERLRSKLGVTVRRVSGPPPRTR